MSESVSVVILAKDEERLIARAIVSAWWASEIVVVDSGSSDRTCAVAQALGATVYHQDWLGWRAQHETAATLAMHDWIFSLDADEIVTEELAEAIMAALGAQPEPRNGYVLERREEFLGTLMPTMRRRSKLRTFVRLYNRRFGSYDPRLEIHEQILCPGRLIPLQGFLLHWRNYNIAQQVDTLNRNADIEAPGLAKRPGRFGRLLLVGKPLARFFWLYALCGNWRFGTKGYVWSVLHAGAEFLRHAKAWELENVAPSIDPTPDVWHPGPEIQRTINTARLADIPSVNTPRQSGS
jgi:glycosyltransferase involved in cell wall biosynthesis